MSELKKYVEHLDQLAADGDTDAGKEFAYYYMNELRDEVTPEIAEKIEEYLAEASGNGDAESQTMLAHMYMFGDIVPQNTGKAKEYLMDAAENDDIRFSDLAMTALSAMEADENSDDVSGILHWTVRNYLENSSPSAANMLGEIFASGVLGWRDDEVAFDLYMEAEDKLREIGPLAGNPEPIYVNIAEALLQGTGVDIDPYEAMSYLAKAESGLYMRMHDGDPNAQNELDEVLELKETARRMIDVDLLDQNNPMA